MRQFVPLDLPHVEIIRESQRGAIYAFKETVKKRKAVPVSFQKRRNPAINEAIDIAPHNMNPYRSSSIHVRK